MEEFAHKIKNMFKSQDTRRVEALMAPIDKLEQQIEKICAECQVCEAEMKRCLEAGRFYAPDSSEYYSLERKFNTAKNALALKKKEAERLIKMLEEARHTLLPIRHKITDTDVQAGEKSPVNIDELINARIDNDLQTLKNALYWKETPPEINPAASILDEHEVNPDNEFARIVMGASIREKEKNTDPREEFDRLVNNNDTKN